MRESYKLRDLLIATAAETNANTEENKMFWSSFMFNTDLLVAAYTRVAMDAVSLRKRQMRAALRSQELACYMHEIMELEKLVFMVRRNLRLNITL